MKLILTRHAKSSWDDFTLDDHDRPLNARGKSSARAIGLWLNDHGHVPSHALSSTAERAKWTTALMIEGLDPRPHVSFHSGLYHAGPDAMLTIASAAPEGDLIIVGHNPGMSELARMMCKTRPDHQDFSRYPTAATLVLNVPIDNWRDLQFGSGEIVDFIVPRELDGAA